MKRLLLLTATFLPLASFCQLQEVKDILPGVFSSDPSRMTVFNYNLYFFAGDEGNGYELRSYNGTSVKLIKDIYSGTKDCAPKSPGKKMAVLGNKLYFPADNGTSGLELHSYDGASNTKLVSDIAGGLNSSQIDEIIAYNGKLYFDANNGSNGKELWEYDPVTDKAEQLSFINTGAGSDPEWITAISGKIYFTAFEPSAGRELYQYNISTGVTSRVEDIYPGAQGGNPSGLMDVFGTLYFSAVSPDYGRELYKYDGTTVQRLTDLNTGTADGVSMHPDGMPTLGAAGDNIFFAGDDGGGADVQLFRYNYQSNTTHPVATINPSGASTPASFSFYAYKLFFTADDGTHGRELWMLDKNGQASMVADINTNTAVSVEPAGMVVYQDKLYFSAYGANGNELYQYTDPAAGIEHMQHRVDVQVFPNPAVGELYFRFDVQRTEVASIHLADMTGRVVYSTDVAQYEKGDNTIRIPVDRLQPGVYFYQVRNAVNRPLAAGKFTKM